MPYLSASKVMVHKDVLYQVFVPLPLPLEAAVTTFVRRHETDSVLYAGCKVKNNWTSVSEIQTP